MFFVYILKSLKDGKFYTGSTGNIKDRLQRHYEGRVKSTRNRRPLKLVYFEKFDNRSEAVKREMYLKSLEGGARKKELVDNFPEEKLREIEGLLSCG